MRLPALLAGGLLVAGCGGAPPVRDLEPTADLPEQWTAVPEGAAERDGAAVTTWWDSFPEESLRDLVSEALARNPDLAAASARLEAAAAEARIGGADVFPQVSAGGSASRRKQIFVGLPIPTAGGGPVSSTSESYGVSLDVSWEADVWGRARAARSASAADLEAARADWEAARLSLAAQTLKAVFACREAERQAALAEETVASHLRTEERIRARYREGVRPSVDLRLAISDRAAAEAALARRRSARDRAARQLELLLGRYPAARFDPGGELGPVPGPVPAGLPVDLLRRRPDLVAAERRFAAAGRRTWQSKADLLPRLTLTGSAGRSSAEVGDLLDGDFTVWSLAANLLQPIFQGGRLRAGVSRAAALEDAAEATWAGLVLRALAEVETALGEERHLAEEETARALAAEQAAAAFDLTLARYESGLADATDLLSAQRAARTAESLRLDARRRRLEARVDLHLALGGGFALADATDALPTVSAEPAAGSPATRP